MLASLLLLSSAQLSAANTKTTVAQVTATVSVTTDVDYVVTGATPFADAGIVNLQNTDHAVLILQAVKPSKALGLLADHVQINGEKAVNGINCQVKMYNRGCIVLPYGTATKPLTVYSGQNYQGTAVNDFGLENSGGFMNTLTDAKLNNKIRSFRLKRGYMVTFSTLPGGRGYSRCFIAANADLEFATLPAVLDQTISSYRVFKWYDFSKAGIANDTRKEVCDATNVQGCYSFGLGEDRGIDTECVPHHIYEDWPSAAACGSVTYSPHLKTNNEPGNSADDHPQSVETILNNWENLMATGMRLCSPSSHDGSLNHLRAFLDSIDARGWRCDIVDIHSYWDKGSFGNLAGWYNSYGRPIWVSEWVWGASWNNNGIFNTGAYNRNDPGDKEYNANKSAVSEICNNMNSWSYVERYFYWNSEANCSKIYRDGKLTPAGEWYAQQNPGLGFQNVQHTPKTPAQKDPSAFTVSYNKTTRKATLKWRDGNGEWNKAMVVERSTDGGKTWEEYYTPRQAETASNYSYTDENSLDGYSYRIHITDLNSRDRYSSVQTCVIEDATTGDAVTVDGKSMYIGGNQILNANFDLGLQGWTNGTGQPIGAPCFQVCDYDAVSGPYLMSWTSMLASQEGSLMQSFDLLPNTQYYFAFYLRNAGGNTVKLELADGTQVMTTAKTTPWQMQAAKFNSGNNAKATFRASQIDRARFDGFMLCRLFDSRDEAIADAMAYQRQKAEAAIAYNTAEPALNVELQAVLTATTGNSEAELNNLQAATDQLHAALRQLPQLQQLVAKAQAYVALGLPDTEELEDAVTTTATLSQASQLSGLIQKLEQELAKLPQFELMAGAVNNPSFTSSGSGWNVKTGTYQGGDQRQNTVLGKTCWNAWWNTADQAQTLGISQQLTAVPEGIYYLSAQATTEHYCLSDQHAFMHDEAGQRVESPWLAYDRFDYPDVAQADAWQTLTTMPLYFAEGSNLTIGFESSKQHAQTGAWVRPGSNKNNANSDNREGWWCATGFQLYRLPICRLTNDVPNYWRTIILPQDYKPGKGVQLYEVAGMTSENGRDYVCLSPVESQTAGVPCVCFSEGQQTDFFVSGEAVTSPVVGENSLTGNFSVDYNITKIPASKIGSLVLIDGEWKELTADEMPYAMKKGTAYISGGRKRLTVLPSWEGAKLPIEGVSVGIAATRQADSTAPVQRFTLGGRPAGTAQRGIVVEKQGDSVKKLQR